MSPPLVIDPEAVRTLARRLDAAADEADHLRTRLLGVLTLAALDDASPAGALLAVDEELRLVAAVLRSRAAQAEYPLRDMTAFALAADATRAARALDLVVGPIADGVAEGRHAAQRLLRAGSGTALLPRILGRADDPSFAHGFAEVLTPLRAAELVLERSSLGPYSPSAGPSGPDERAAWSDGQRLLLDALAHVYVTATQWSGPTALVPVGADAWVQTITTDAGGRGAALALLLAHGDFDDAFLTAIAGGVYEYERAHARGSSPLWRPRSYVGSTYIGPIAPDGSHAYDPMASVLGALAVGGRAAAAQAFFGGGPESARLAYLLGARRWPTDDGAGLGAALAAATTLVRDRSDAGRVSAQLASHAIAVVGARTGTGRGWLAPEGVRPALAAIVASYMPDVFQTVQAAVTQRRPEGYAAGNPSFPPDGPYGATFTVDDLRLAIEAVGTDPERTRQLVAAVLGTERLRLGYAIDRLAAADPSLAADFLTDAGGGGRASLALLTNAVAASGSALGLVIAHGYRGLRDAEARRAEAQRQLRELLAIAVDLPFVKPAGEWGKLVLDHVTAQLFEAWQARAPNDAGAVYGALDLAVANELRDQVLDQLLARGLLTPGVAIAGFVPPPPGALVAGSDPPRFDRRSAAYVDWATSYAPHSWIEVQVGLFYANAFGRVP